MSTDNNGNQSASRTRQSSKPWQKNSIIRRITVYGADGTFLREYPWLEKVVRRPDGTKFAVRCRPEGETHEAREIWAHEHLRAIRLGEIVAKPASLPTVGSYLRDREAALVVHDKPSSAARFKSAAKWHVDPFFHDVPLDQVAPRQTAFIAWHKKRKVTPRRNGKSPVLSGAGLNVSPATINHSLHVIDRMLKLAAEEQLIPNAPRIKYLQVRQKEIRWLSESELDRLVDAAVDDVSRLVILLGADAGLRAGEMLGLKSGCIDVATRRLRVANAVSRGELTTPKTNRSRSIDMTTRLIDAFQRVRHGVFVFGGNDHYGGDGLLRYRLYLACKAAGIERLGFHALRHTFCTHLYVATGDIEAVRIAAGHARLDTTQKYIHLVDEQKRAAIEKLEAHRAKHNHSPMK